MSIVVTAPRYGISQLKSTPRHYIAQALVRNTENIRVPAFVHGVTVHIMTALTVHADESRTLEAWSCTIDPCHIVLCGQDHGPLVLPAPHRFLDDVALDAVIAQSLWPLLKKKAVDERKFIGDFAHTNVKLSKNGEPVEASGPEYEFMMSSMFLEEVYEALGVLVKDKSLLADC